MYKSKKSSCLKLNVPNSFFVMKILCTQLFIIRMSTLSINHLYKCLKCSSVLIKLVFVVLILFILEDQVLLKLKKIKRRFYLGHLLAKTSLYYFFTRKETSISLNILKFMLKVCQKSFVLIFSLKKTFFCAYSK